MSNQSQHPHAEFDRFPEFVRGLIEEFGRDGIDGVVARFLSAEEADFCWEGRIAEKRLGAACEAFEERGEALQRVAVLGYFAGRYYVATCLVDAAHRLRTMAAVGYFESVENAESAFAASD